MAEFARVVQLVGPAGPIGPQGPPGPQGPQPPIASEAEALAGTDDTKAMTPAKVAVRDEKYDVRRSGADTSAVDNTTAFNDAVAVVNAAVRGTLLIPYGSWNVAGVFDVNHSQVNVEGAGMGATTIVLTAAAAKVVIGDRSGTSFRGGAIGNFRINGGGVADNGLVLGLLVERTLRDIDVIDCGTNIVLEGTQNCTFINVNGRDATAVANLVLDYGAGSNVFVRCEFGDADLGWNVKFLQTGAGPAGTFDGPSYNEFHGCLVERMGSDSLDGQVYHGAGSYNTFFGGQISMGQMTTPADKPLVRLRKDGASPSGDLRFIGTRLFGRSQASVFYHKAIDAQGGGRVRLVSADLANLAVAYSIADNQRIDATDVNLSNVTTTYETTGSDAYQNAVIRRLGERTAQVMPALANTAMTVAVAGETRERLAITAGGVMSWTDGSAVSDVQLSRIATGILGSSTATHQFLYRPAVSTAASTSSLTPYTTRNVTYLTALAAACTINAVSGTAGNGQTMEFWFYDDGTARALTWNAVYVPIGVTLPTTTVVGKWTYVRAQWSAAHSEWHVTDVKVEA